MTPGDFHGHAGLGRIDDPAGGAPRRRDVLVARRNTTIQKHILVAEKALARGAPGVALSAAEQAGLLDPDNPRVLAILETARSLPGGRGEPPRPPGGFVGPASWSNGTPFSGTPRSAGSALSVAVSIAGHVVIVTAAVIALIRVVPAIEVTPMMLLELPAAMAGAAVPPDALEPDVPEETVEEEPELTPITANTPLSQIPFDVEPVRRRAVTSSVSLRRTRSSSRRGVPGSLGRASSLVSGRGPWQDVEADRPPLLIRAVPPLYPQTAFDEGFEGIVVVIVQVVLNGEGVVERTSIVEGLPLLNQAARDAVQQWEYRPARRNGFRVPSIFTVSITFDFR